MLTRGNDGTDGNTKNESWSMTPWAPCLAICIILVILFVIVVVIVGSLIPVYLSSKGTDINVASTNSAVRLFTMNSAINLALTGSQTIANQDGIGAQVNKALGYSTPVVAVRTTSLTNGGKRKRQTRVGLSCGGSSVLSLGLLIIRCPDSSCITDSCFEKCAADIKRRIELKLASVVTPITITTNDGSELLASIIFCSFSSYNSDSTSTVATTKVATTIASTTPLPACSASVCCVTSCTLCLDSSTVRYCGATRNNDGGSGLGGGSGSGDGRGSYAYYSDKTCISSGSGGGSCVI
ncbi:unnamed protein product [Adineta ricciae]|uniref:Uncharacterized protein n=1 Tax=Adineta ricciae TaxID=249248 RepID=A0A815AE16_ADIRI|nr:unnamed protein product [Adineta ricciae]